MNKDVSATLDARPHVSGGIEHVSLRTAALEQFIPRFLRDPKVLRLRPASNRNSSLEREALVSLGIVGPAHDMLPDVVVLDQARQWLVLIAVRHPISKLRHLALEDLTAGCALPKVFVSVFANRKEFRKWVLDISWETEVWLADSPDHLIHFNGDRYLGPHPSR